MDKRLVNRRQFLKYTGAIGALAALQACAPGRNPGVAATATPGVSSVFTPQPPAGLTPNGEQLQVAKGFQAILANSHQVVGPNRFALGLIENGRSVDDANVHVKFYDLTSGSPAFKSESDALFYGDNLGAAGVYVTHTVFDKAGPWGMEVTALEPGQPAKLARVGFDVLAKDSVPNIGDAAPRTKNPTLKDVAGDRSKICSAVADDSALHQMSIADAVTGGKPTAILFATPAFCTSRTCGPSLDVVKALQLKYFDKANFIHIEVYKDFQTFQPADAMLEWQLETEPWLFFVGKDGKVAQRFEGGITQREIEPEFLNFIGA
jgi:TAT (twin-arginine translocation) pathway-exported protein